MRDAVAEVLDERQILNSSPSVFVVLSIAFHVGLAVLIATAAARQATLPPKPIITVKLAGAAATPAAPVRATPTAKPKATPPKVEPQPKPVEKEIAPEPPKPPKRTSEGRSLFGRSDLEPAKSAKPQPAPPQESSSTTTAGSGSARAPLPGIGKAGVTALEGGPFPYSLYVDRMVSLIGTRWFRPESGELLAEVYFVIERDGRIRDVKINKSSGNSVFDRAAYRAVVESSPLPPLPAAYTGTYLGVHLTFH